MGRIADGFVLAGGRSRRMGTDKAGLPVRGITLLQHAIDCLLPVCRRVTVVGREARDLPPEVDISSISDSEPGLGPLGGVITALSECKQDFCLILAVDMPAVTREVLLNLRDHPSDADVVVPKARGFLQSLCARYRTTCLGSIKAYAEKGGRSLYGILQMLDVVEISYAQSDIFRDIDTPDDLKNHEDTR